MRKSAASTISWKLYVYLIWLRKFQVKYVYVSMYIDCIYADISDMREKV